MKKCKYCGDELMELNALNAFIIDFDFLKTSSNTKIAIDTGKIKINKGIIQGQVKDSTYCQKCGKLFVELDECL